MAFPENLLLLGGPPGWIAYYLIWSSKDKKARRDAYAAWQSYNPDHNLHGSAAWATAEMIRQAGAFEDRGGVPVGYFDGKPIYHNEDTSILTFGRSGEGKGSQIIIPAVLTAKDTSFVVPDIDAEIFHTTVEQRLRCGPCYIVDPYEMASDVVRKIPRSCYNAAGLHWLNPAHPQFWPRLSRLSTGLVPKSHGHDDYWDIGSRQVARDFLGVLRKYAKNESVTLTRLAQLIEGDLPHFARWLIASGILRDDPLLCAKIARWANPRSMDIRSLPELLENTKTHLSTWLDDSIANVSRHSTFAFSEGAERVITVYMLAPHELLAGGEVSRWLTTMITCAASELVRFNPNRRKRTVLLLDEFFELPLENVDHLLISARKAKTTLWLSMQDTHELRLLYPQTFQTFLSSAGCVQFLSASDSESSKLVSDMLGNVEVVAETKTQSWSAGSGVSKAPKWQELSKLSMTVNRSQVARPLMLPQEVRRIGNGLARNQQILFLRGVEAPILCERKSYLDVPRLARIAGVNPYYANRPGNKTGRLVGSDWMKLLS